MLCDVVACVALSSNFSCLGITFFGVHGCVNENISVEGCMLETVDWDEADSAVFVMQSGWNIAVLHLWGGSTSEPGPKTGFAPE